MNKRGDFIKRLNEADTKIKQRSWDSPREVSATFHRLLEMFLPLTQYGFFQMKMLFSSPYGAIHLYSSKKFKCRMRVYLNIEQFGDIVRPHFDYGHSRAIDEHGECIRAGVCRCWVDSTFISYYLAGIPPNSQKEQLVYWKQLKRKTLAQYPLYR